MWSRTMRDRLRQNSEIQKTHQWLILKEALRSMRWEVVRRWMEFGLIF